MRMIEIAVLSVALTFAALSLRIAAAADAGQQAGADWPTVGGGNSNSRYSPLAKINTSNVRRLGGAWLRELQTPTRTPGVIVNGMIVIADASSIYALDPKTGDTLWMYKPEGGAPARGGVATGEGLVFCGLSDTRLIALDQRTGHLVWSSYIGNAPAETAVGTARAVSFGEGIPKFDPKVGLIVNAPTYVNGVVTSGISGGDGGSRGKIAGISAKRWEPLMGLLRYPVTGRAGFRELARVGRCTQSWWGSRVDGGGSGLRSRTGLLRNR